MQESHPTTRQHPGAVIAHALAALAGHMLEHGLPSPASIEPPARLRDDYDGLTVTVRAADAEAWLEGCARISAAKTRLIGDTGYQLVTADCLLDDTGVRVRIQYATSVRLTAVPA